MTIKLYMEKALEWQFTHRCFTDLGFREKWTKWIIESITTTNFSVIVKGISWEPFRPEKCTGRGETQDINASLLANLGWKPLVIPITFGLE